MQAFFTYTFLTRGWPVWARYLGATLVVLIMLMLRIGLSVYLPAFPFLLFFMAIIVNAVIFNRGSGFYTVALSAVLADYFFLEPVGSLRIDDSRTVLGLILYLMIGFTTAGIIEALHTTAHSLTRANKRLAAAEQEKDLLLREAGHRMKNDLMTLTALVRLQERAVQDPSAKSALSSTADRIHVLSRVQERLRLGQGTSAVINVADFITELCDDLKTALVDLRPIAVTVRAERHLLPQERVVPVGLIINELLTNSLKYAFPDDRGGTITVDFSRESDTFRVAVADDGVGLPPESRPGPSSGLGTRLIRSMVAQLGGTINVEPNGNGAGTVITVRFPREP
ncbi:sensor histidine kinase [Microvirga arabica]|uniref:histidine kinase n=1 Tax=Microvirga arabica TaxID=1128671 RepID=A0ABV6YA25_9HYPH